MSWSLSDSADELLDKRGAVLLANESLNNLTWAAIARSKIGSAAEPDYGFLTLDEGPSTRAHAFLKHSSQELVLGAMSSGDASTLAAFLGSQGVSLQLVDGAREAALSFAKSWTQATGAAHAIQINQGLYELTRVRMPDAAGGHMVAATEAERGLLQDFFAGFCRDCFPDEPVPAERVRARIQRLLDQKRGYLWRNREGALVSMAAVVRESPNTTSLSLVYTPRSRRGQGYAARIVAALSQAQLDGGKKACNLHTDLKNATSNGVYLRIGYELIGQCLRLRIFQGAQKG